MPYSVNNVKVVYYGDNMCSGHAAGLDLKLFGEFVRYRLVGVAIADEHKYELNGKSIPLPTDQRYAVNLFFTDYFPGTTRWKMSLKLALADGLPFSAPHRELESNVFRARIQTRRCWFELPHHRQQRPPQKRNPIRNLWVGAECLNLFGINNVNSYYWITDVTGQQYAVPNYLTGRQINVKLSVDF